MELYFSSAKTKQFGQIAVDAGWSPGAQLTKKAKVYFAPQFTDQNWRKPDLKEYAVRVAEYRPHCASVIDWENHVELSEVLAWAEEIAPFVNYVIIIPKVIGGILSIPEHIGGKPVRLGYSVPTSHGGTGLALAEFGQRPVHLLGGSPQKQMRLYHMLNVVSADGNYMQKQAMRNQFFALSPVRGAKNKNFPQLQEVGDGALDTDTHLEAFSRSAENIMTAWKRVLAKSVSDLPLFSLSASISHRFDELSTRGRRCLAVERMGGNPGVIEGTAVKRVPKLEEGGEGV